MAHAFLACKDELWTGSLYQEDVMSSSSAPTKRYAALSKLDGTDYRTIASYPHYIGVPMEEM